MAQQDKELLLKDLCGRLLYGIKGRVYAECSKGEYDMNGDMIFFDSPFDVTLDDINISTEEIHVTAIGNEDTVDFIEDQQTWGDPYTIDNFEPYLRPMSSMTEDESAELSNIISEWFDKELFYLTEEPFLEYALSRINYSISPLLFDWLNAHHFDYRGLIPMGLALEAPEEMYSTKEKE